LNLGECAESTRECRLNSRTRDGLDFLADSAEHLFPASPQL
jgi:hypothetical protein